MYVVFFKQKPAYEMRISDWSSDGCSSDLLAREVDTIREQIPQALRGVEAFLDRYGLGQRVRELAEVGSDDLSRLASRAGGYAIAAGRGAADFCLRSAGRCVGKEGVSTFRSWWPPFCYKKNMTPLSQ